MSWKRSTKRDLDISIQTTPSNIGPGSYDVESKKQDIHYRGPCFGSGSRRQLNLEQGNYTPAPGEYDPILTNRSVVVTSSFKSNTKRVVFEESDMPDPTSYSHQPDWSPKKKIRGEIKKEKYKPSSPFVGQSIEGYVLGEDGSVKSVKKVPNGSEWVGPGSYSPQLPSTSKVHSMSESYRTDLMAQNTGIPGPGSYDVSISKRNGFTISEKIPS